MSDPKRKAEFIHALAVFVAGNSAAKSIDLEIKTKRPQPVPLPQWPQEWASVVSSGPHFGWCSVEEAEKLLTEFLS